MERIAINANPNGTLKLERITSGITTYYEINRYRHTKQCIIIEETIAYFGDEEVAQAAFTREYRKWQNCQNR